MGKKYWWPIGRALPALREAIDIGVCNYKCQEDLSLYTCIPGIIKEKWDECTTFEKLIFGCEMLLEDGKIKRDLAHKPYWLLPTKFTLKL